MSWIIDGLRDLKKEIDIEKEHEKQRQLNYFVLHRSDEGIKKPLCDFSVKEILNDILFAS